MAEWVLPDGRVLTLPIVHVALLGNPNAGKSEFAASMEKPELVIATDPWSKMQAYHDRGDLDPKEYTGQFGQRIQIVRSRNPVTAGKPIIQIEFYADEDLINPQAFGHLLTTRFPQIKAEVNAKVWKSVVIDSWTQLEWLAYQRRSIGAFKSDSVAGGAKDDLKQLLNAYLMHLRCNLCIILHVESKMIDQGGGVLVYSPRATGQLKVDLLTVLGETYLAVAAPDATQPNGVRYYLQTVKDGRFELGTRIGAPNGCDNHYPAIFTNWIAKHAAKGAVAPVIPQPPSAADGGGATTAAPAAEGVSQ